MSTTQPQQKREPWEKLETETAPAFDAFTRYRDMPKSDRSLEACYKTYMAERGKSAERASGRWTTWCRVNRWVERADAYDRHMDAVKLKARETAMLDGAERWARMGQFMQASAMQALRNKDFDRAGIRELRLLAETGAKLEERAYTFELELHDGENLGEFEEFLAALEGTEGEEQTERFFEEVGLEVYEPDDSEDYEDD